MPNDLIDIRENVPLAPLTTLGVGGNARFFAEARTPDEVAAAVRFSSNRKWPLFVLGGGSNLLVSDRGFDGLVLHIAIEGITEGRRDDRVLFDVGAGVDWDDFVSQSVSLGFGGIECLSGIPGSVGGTPVQNVGAYGQEVSEVIDSVLAYDISKKQLCGLTAAECGFSYRSSIFNSSERGRYIILQVTYALSQDKPPSLHYADLQKYFAGRDGTPTLEETRNAVRNIRSAKGMLLSPGDPDSRSAGSFFKNPVLSTAEHEELVRKATERKLLVPSYPALSEHKKVSAAWLVENSGFSRGYAKGNVGISSKHALALVNRGSATAAEIVALKNEIQAKVEDTWGIQLEPEPVFVGF